MALQSNSIELEDAIDVRNIKNLKLANQMLKVRRQKKIKMDQMLAQQNIESQAQANAQAQQVAAQAEVQKQNAINSLKLQGDAQKAELEANKLQLEAELKKDLMAQEFEYNLALKNLEHSSIAAREKEGRKDDASKEAIAARKNKNFESSGNDIMSGSIGLGRFEPS